MTTVSFTSTTSPNVAAAFDCSAQDCNFVLYEAMHDPVFLHNALKLARKKLDKTSIMIPSSDLKEKPKNPAKASLQGYTEEQFGLQDDERDQELFRRHRNCEDGCNDGIDWTTTTLNCVKSESPLFHNLEHGTAGKTTMRSHTATTSMTRQKKRGPPQKKPVVVPANKKKTIHNPSRLIHLGIVAATCIECDEETANDLN
ncbi:expressed unknown protein [Seminavis robusta]|uniref:Uncharacterized protein n=1 Tax=Seminavis robusta TaxID=568900 RepID=A0A9N8EHF0_9STRA|nr:expressed unknown protein [Seminavis robusta]|eukprot:Sro999_g229620.1 n/a (200) ;mRNA; f:10540-11139